MFLGTLSVHNSMHVGASSVKGRQLPNLCASPRVHKQHRFAKEGNWILLHLAANYYAQAAHSLVHGLACP